MHHSLPIGSDGELSLNMLYHFMAKRKEKEDIRARAEEARALDYVETPLSADVVLGRGYPYQRFPGNVHLAMLIDQHRLKYQSSDRPNKTAISNMIVEEVKKGNGRFLTKRKNNLDGWEVVSDETARDKVSHGFRTKTRRSANLLKDVMS